VSCPPARILPRRPSPAASLVRAQPTQAICSVHWRRRARPSQPDPGRDEISGPGPLLTRRSDAVISWLNTSFQLRFRVIDGPLPRSMLDIIDVGHSTWEDAADQYAALVASWWGQGGTCCGQRSTSVSAPSRPTPCSRRRCSAEINPKSVRSGGPLPRPSRRSATPAALSRLRRSSAITPRRLSSGCAGLASWRARRSRIQYQSPARVRILARGRAPVPGRPRRRHQAHGMPGGRRGKSSLR
jgi:hypothetical protein